MGQHDAPQAAQVQAGQKFGRLGIGQVPPRTADAGLQGGRIRASRQQLRTVVGLQQQGVATLEHRQHMGRHMPGIRENTQAALPIGNHELHRLGGIMGHGKGQNLQIAHLKALSGADALQGGQLAELGLAGGSMGGVDRQAQSPCHRAHASGMVPMLVGEQNGAQTVQLQPGLLQASLQMLFGKAAIDQQRALRPADDQCIAFAAAAEDPDLHAPTGP